MNIAIRGAVGLTKTTRFYNFSRWDDVLKLLQKSHGADTKVAVYPNADIQYYRMKGKTQPGERGTP